ncbi:MAG: NADP-dependent phosphogluconate dehydrogenase [Bacteroidota bacterium]
MQIGLIGLGKMGYNLALNMTRNGHSVVAFDASKAAMERIQPEGVKTVSSLNELPAALSGLHSVKATRRVIWMMVPAGQVVDVIINNLKNYLNADDILIDGGNSFYKDSINRAKELEKMGVHLLDCGTSGGVEGALKGICTMIGGWKDAFDYCSPLFKSICVDQGFLYCGKSGSGHFVKMVHNGIEYGMMQSIAEGFELMNRHNPNMDLAAISNVWNHGSVASPQRYQPSSGSPGV